jgi:hypothetical protein
MRRPLGVLATLLVLALAGAPPALADSAADKATAREVATEGIELYRAGKYAEALDRLRRAQALYDAPVHLLYIARAEEKLGQLVEGSETYRTLDRYPLPPGAPEAWVAAVDDGRKELAALEPRLPKLRIVVEPKDAPEATVQIDGAPVSSAVIGIARAVNPGAHHVVVAAKGYTPSESDVQAKEGETKDIALTLAPVKGDAPVSENATAGPGTGRALVGFMFGLRLGAGIPTGKILHYKDTADVGHDLNVSDAFQPGAGLELHAGVRIAGYFTPLVFVEGQTFSGGDHFFNANGVKNTTATSLGFGLLVGTPPGRMGGFGEFDLLLANNFALTVPSTAGKCEVTAKGGALRFGGGGVFPLARWLQLTPFAMATIGRFTRLEGSSACATADTNLDTVMNHDLPSADARTHATIVLGVGGDVVLGPGR